MKIIFPARLEETLVKAVKAVSEDGWIDNFSFSTIIDAVNTDYSIHFVEEIGAVIR